MPFSTPPNMSVSMIQPLPPTLPRSVPRVSTIMLPYPMPLRSSSGWSTPWRRLSSHTDRQRNEFQNLFSERRPRRSARYAVWLVVTFLHYPQIWAWLLIVSLKDLDKKWPPSFTDGQTYDMKTWSAGMVCKTISAYQVCCGKAAGPHRRHSWRECVLMSKSSILSIPSVPGILGMDGDRCFWVWKITVCSSVIVMSEKEKTTPIPG